MPGFTHLQHAQPVTLAHHLLAYEEAFGRDYARLSDAYSRVNTSPLGAAAFASTGFAIDRRYTQKMLGFDAIATNTMDAVAARDFALEVLADNAILMTTVSRFCEEIVLWSSPLIGFVQLADPYCSSSSIMPQKKNPDTAEVMRAKAASSAGELVAGLGCIKGLPMSYNRDLQELWPHLWRSVADVRSSIPLLAGLTESAVFDRARMAAEAGRGFSTATELADVLVREYGLPFRTAHTIVGRAVRSGTLDLAALEEAAGSIAGCSLVESGLTEKRIAAALDVRTVVEAKRAEGGPAPSAVQAALAERGRLLAQHRTELEALREGVTASKERLIAKARELVGI
jgi:argininosuccinate lyase